MSQAVPEMSVYNNENLSQSQPLPSNKTRERAGEDEVNSSLDLDFSLGDTFDFEIPGCSPPLSFPSEPPDIRNWFSSYVYESPDLDTEVDFNNAIPGESTRVKSPIAIEDIDRRKEKDIAFEGDNILQSHSLNKSLQEKRNIIRTDTDKLLEGKQIENQDLVPVEDDANLCLSNGNSPEKLEKDISAKGDTVLSDIISQPMSLGCVSPQEGLLEGMQRKQHNLKRKHLTQEVEHTSDLRKNSWSTSIKSVSLNNCPEEETRSINASGFVSTKNIHRTENNVRSLKCSKENQVGHTRNSPLVGQVEEMRTIVRRPLTERTNVINKVVAPETTGKWLCPQKSKPDLGPRLKQLRLERWIHRVV